MDSPYTAFSSGMIVQISDGGYEIGEITYEMPPYVLKSNYKMDTELFSVLRVLKRKKIKTYRKILRATEAFMGSYFNSPEFSYESRILQQARSFEILFDLPEAGQRKEFKEKIKRYCFPRDKKSQREIVYKSERPNGKKAVRLIT